MSQQSPIQISLLGEIGTIMVTGECVTEVLDRARPTRRTQASNERGITHGGDEAEDRGRAA
jgi:hypothetical protein